MREYSDTFHQLAKWNWRWIDRRALEVLHDESLAEHGGASGLRDEGLLESALARPLNLAAYAQADVSDLATTFLEEIEAVVTPFDEHQAQQSDDLELGAVACLPMTEVD